MMISRIRWISIGLTIALAGGLTILAKEIPRQTQGYSDTLKTVAYSESLTIEKQLTSRFHLISGELVLFPLSTLSSASKTLFRFQAEYKSSADRPYIAFESGPLAKLVVNLKRYQHYRFSSKTNWSLGLSPDLEHHLFIETQTARHSLDLSGLPIKTFSLKTKAGMTSLLFKEPNPIEMDQLKIESSAGDCRITGFIYAKAKDIYLKSAAGNVTLECSKNEPLINSSRIHIYGKIGNAHLILSPDIPVRLTVARGKLVFKSIKGFSKISSTTYVSPLFNEAKPYLDIYVSLNSGKLNVQL